jgi:D-glycero-alpha-D-manno-heptose-7-phosphate kinase
MSRREPAGVPAAACLTVGLLNALYGYQGKSTSHAQLAQEACHIEIEILGKPIGRQDQYASAFGGLNYIRFNPDGSVEVEPIPCTRETVTELQRHMLLVYTGKARNADTILLQQRAGTSERMHALREMRDLAMELKSTLTGSPDLELFSRLMHTGWELKRSLGFGISNGHVDDMYAAARSAGAVGGKLLGAGGSGFLLLMAPPERHKAIRAALDCPVELDFSIDRRGSRLVFISDHQKLTRN